MALKPLQRSLLTEIKTFSKSDHGLFWGFPTEWLSYWFPIQRNSGGDFWGLFSVIFNISTYVCFLFQILSQVPDLFQLLCDSIFPNITGNDQIKKGLVLSLFGGTEKFDPECECVHVRDYIHVLLLGSRCSQKNQILKSITSLMNETSCYLVGSCSSLKLIATNTKRRKCLPDEPDAAFICDKKSLFLFKKSLQLLMFCFRNYLLRRAGKDGETATADC